MFDTEQVRRTIEQRRRRIRHMWCSEQENEVTYREVEAAVQSVGNKGYDTSRARALLARGEELYGTGRYDDLLPVICQINQALREAPRLCEPAGEPDTLEAIRASWPARRQAPELDARLQFDKVLGGWQGKNIGGMLGGSLEGWTRQRIQERYGLVEDYVEKPPSAFNDDIAFELVLLHALEEHGLGLTSAQLGLEWMAHLPLEYCYTAERVAMNNMLRGVMPPACAVLDNPFSEWVGAQMKGNVCGLIAPGRPDLAAEYAFLDGVVAHEREGVYGEVFVAAATSLAFALTDVRQVVHQALDYVPPSSRYAQVIRQTIAWCGTSADWQEACRRVEESYAQEYHWVHVLPNAAMVVIALLFGAGDPARTVSIATTCGLDVDCNGGVAGGIVGVLKGSSGLPPHLVEPLGERIDTWVVGFEDLALRDLAERTCAIAAGAVAQSGRRPASH